MSNGSQPRKGGISPAAPARLYSPSGRMRLSAGSGMNNSGSRQQTPPQAYQAKNSGANRVRREPAVQGSSNAMRSLSPGGLGSTSRTNASNTALRNRD